MCDERQNGVQPPSEALSPGVANRGSLRLGDGLLDLIAANDGSNDVTVLLNQDTLPAIPMLSPGWLLLGAGALAVTGAIRRRRN